MCDGNGAVRRGLGRSVRPVCVNDGSVCEHDLTLEQSVFFSARVCFSRSDDPLGVAARARGSPAARSPAQMFAWDSPAEN